MKHNTKNILYFAVAFWLIVTAVVLFFFWPLISQEINYLFGKKTNEPPQEKVEKKEDDGSIVYDVPDKLVVPKINVEAPIIQANSVEEEDILKALESGVAHYPNTAMPGRVGNVFLTGHSSNYVWADGSFNHVFSLLNKLAVGDKIYIYYNKSRYTYEVFDVLIVSAKEISVLDQGLDSIVTLMTCDPPGTTWKRRIVKAKQIEPDPKNNKTDELEVVKPSTLVGN